MFLWENMSEKITLKVLDGDGRIKINLGEVGCEDGRRVELTQDHVKWRLWS
jgi:hypothetical protein